MTALFSLLLLSPIAGAFVEFEGKTFYLGDLHTHTGISRDGGSTDLGNCRGDCGAFSEVFDIARANGLDFLSLTEHVNGDQSVDEAGFAQEMEALREVGAATEGLVLLPGVELWWQFSDTRLGHKNLYFRASDAELTDLTLADVRFDGARETITDCSEMWDFVEQVESQWGPVMMLAHHPAMSGGMGTDWSCHLDPRAARLSPAMEIYSRHGNSEECEPDFDPVWQVCDPEQTAIAALDPGTNALRMGFLGGTDEHDTQPGGICQQETQLSQHPYGGGLTVAVLDGDQPLTRGSLFDAIAARSTYATSGPLLPVNVSWRVGDEHIGSLGEDLPVPEGVDLEVEVRVPSDNAGSVTEVQLITPREKYVLTDMGRGRYAGRASGDDRPAWAYIRILMDGEAWYGETGCEDGGEDHAEYLWLSPSWLVLPDSDTGLADDTGQPDTGTTPHDSDDSTPPADSEEPDDCGCDCECECECSCGGDDEERGCGLLGVSGLFALALSAVPLVLGRRTSRA